MHSTSRTRDSEQTNVIEYASTDRCSSSARSKSTDTRIQCTPSRKCSTSPRGGTSMVEQQMMVVNYLVLYQRVMNLKHPHTHNKQSQHPDELGDADFPPTSPHHEPLVAARCVNGTLLRPGNAEEEPPSTACRTERGIRSRRSFHWAEEFQGSTILQEA